MKRLRNWVAATLVTTSFVLTAGPVFAVEAKAAGSLRHPSDARVDAAAHTPADLDLVRKVRNALTTNDQLSALGKNVVIEARDGNVTLRGLVTNLSERILVADLATRVAGPSRVDNQLEPLATT